MITFPCPTPVHGGLLARELENAGLPTRVTQVGDTIELTDLTDSDIAAAQTVLDAHPATARAVLDAAATTSANRAVIHDRAGQALAANLTDVTTNDTFLAIASPTNAQILAQVKELTRHDTRRAKQVNGLIRLVLNRFDGTD